MFINITKARQWTATTFLHLRNLQLRLLINPTVATRRPCSYYFFLLSCCLNRLVHQSFMIPPRAATADPLQTSMDDLSTILLDQADPDPPELSSKISLSWTTSLTIAQKSFLWLLFPSSDTLSRANLFPSSDLIRPSVVPGDALNFIWDLSISRDWRLVSCDQADPDPPEVAAIGICVGLRCKTHPRAGDLYHATRPSQPS